MLLAALMAYVRLAPTDTALWHITLNPRPLTLGAPSQQVVAVRGGTYVDLPFGVAQLQALDKIALATARTQRVAGSAAAGHITWVTRSQLWGFPDYTTAEIGAQGMTIYARLRFGGGDMGANAARLKAWLAALT